MRVHSPVPLMGTALFLALCAGTAMASQRPDAVMRLAANEADLKLGEYSCIGSGGAILIGLGFRVLPGRKYLSLDNQDGGTYAYDASAATITFIGGFLASFKGEGVKSNQFQIHGASCGPV